MISLGVESTAHTIGIGIIDDEGKIIADERGMIKTKAGTGFVPRDLADHHLEVGAELLRKVFVKSGLKASHIDVFCYSSGPGIPNALRVGATLARFISYMNDKKPVAVNHPVAHIEIGRAMTGSEDPIIVYLSGGNTQIIGFSEGRYRVFGETQDIPVGNMLDVLARDMGMNMPGGPEVERIAKKGSYIEMPYLVKGMDLSFTGLMTDAKKKLKSGAKHEDVCFSVQENAFAMITEVTERALSHTGKSEVLMVGGVAANKRMNSMMKTMCEDRGAKLKVVPEKYSGDNGVMTAWAGIVATKKRVAGKYLNLPINPDWRVDQVEWKL